MEPLKQEQISKIQIGNLQPAPKSHPPTPRPHQQQPNDSAPIMEASNILLENLPPLANTSSNSEDTEVFIAHPRAQEPQDFQASQTFLLKHEKDDFKSLSTLESYLGALQTSLVELSREIKAVREEQNLQAREIKALWKTSYQTQEAISTVNTNNESIRTPRSVDLESEKYQSTPVNTVNELTPKISTPSVVNSSLFCLFLPMVL
jgi:vacuolar-type H+-ATPase subunit I/STV1